MIQQLHLLTFPAICVRLLHHLYLYHFTTKFNFFWWSIIAFDRNFGWALFRLKLLIVFIITRIIVIFATVMLAHTILCFVIETIIVIIVTFFILLCVLYFFSSLSSILPSSMSIQSLEEISSQKFSPGDKSPRPWCLVLNINHNFFPSISIKSPRRPIFCHFPPSYKIIHIDNWRPFTQNNFFAIFLSASFLYQSNTIDHHRLIPPNTKKFPC